MINRRHMLAGTIGGFSAFALRNNRAQALAKAIRSSTRRCIILWMDGGPSQFETFDPKPGTITGGPTKSIATEVDGLELSEHLPNLAKCATDLNVIRTLTSKEGEHERAKYLNHTGFQPIAAFPRPGLGSLFAHRLHEGVMPGFVTVGGGPTYGPAYLARDHAPFVIDDPGRTQQLLSQLQRRRSRFQLLDSLSEDFDSRFTIPVAENRKGILRRVEGLLDTGLEQLLDLGENHPDVQQYGPGEFGKRLLLARRLIENGVSCVEVQLGGWDTHQNNFRSVANLCHQLDQPWYTLIQDLKKRQLWDKTLVVWIGDFGRTPTINAQQGRDHYPGVSNCVIAGGGLPGGVVVGKTSESGSQIDTDAVSTADLFATILQQIGIAPDQEYTTAFGSPTAVTDGGKVIDALTT